MWWKNKISAVLCVCVCVCGGKKLERKRGGGSKMPTQDLLSHLQPSTHTSSPLQHTFPFLFHTAPPSPLQCYRTDSQDNSLHRRTGLPSGPNRRSQSDPKDKRHTTTRTLVTCIMITLILSGHSMRQCRYSEIITQIKNVLGNHHLVCAFVYICVFQHLYKMVEFISCICISCVL